MKRDQINAELDALLAVGDAMAHLKAARDLLIRAKAPRTLAWVRGTIRSAEGAGRHIRERIHRLVPDERS